MNNFAFTLQLPAFLKVPFGASKFTYAGLTPSQQEDVLTAGINHALEIVGYEYKRMIDREIYFEEHKDGRKHAHGTIKDLTEEDIVRVQTAFCLRFGIKKTKQMNEVFNYLPIFNACGWEKYSTKDQPDSVRTVYEFRGKPHLTVEF